MRTTELPSNTWRQARRGLAGRVPLDVPHLDGDKRVCRRLRNYSGNDSK